MVTAEHRLDEMVTLLRDRAANDLNPLGGFDTPEGDFYPYGFLAVQLRGKSQRATYWDTQEGMRYSYWERCSRQRALALIDSVFNGC